MRQSLAEIAQDAFGLPKNEQLELARMLLANAESLTEEEDAEAAWEKEIQRRIQMFDAGLVTARPWEDVLREVRQRLSQRP